MTLKVSSQVRLDFELAAVLVCAIFLCAIFYCFNASCLRSW